MKVFAVINKEHVYGGRVGVFMHEDKTGITLSFGEEEITFNKNEIKQII